MVSDIKSLVSKIQEKGAVLVGFEESQKFTTAARAITGTIKTISDKDLRSSYREFIILVESKIIKPAGKSPKWENKELIKSLLVEDKSNIHIIASAAVKLSVECVVKSIVSRYEDHFKPSRQPTEEHSLDEMVIAENGPYLHHADSILESAMDMYLSENTESGNWHFLRNSEDIIIHWWCK